VVRQQTLTLSFVGSSPPIPAYKLFFKMSVEIQFIKGKKETSLPVIKLTKSINGKTGTATFLFIYPDVFNLVKFQNFNSMYLLWDNKEIITNEIVTIFKNGKPFLLKSIFIFKNEKEWFDFLNFMNSYSKETGLFFTESPSKF
jgi:photosystem II 13kDa protein